MCSAVAVATLGELPGGTQHIIVAAGHEAAVVLAVGAGAGSAVYPVSEVAARYGASAERETTSPGEAYEERRADLPRSTLVRYRPGWLPNSG